MDNLTTNEEDAMHNGMANIARISQRWLTLIGVGMVSTLAITGCSRSEQDNSTQSSNEGEPVVAEEVKSLPKIDCGDALVQEQLREALLTSLNQQTQNLADTYASQAQIQLQPNDVQQKTNTVLIDVQNPSVSSDTNNTGMTMCQASVSMTLPSQDLYQSSQVYAAAGQPSLQERLKTQNIRLNNNMLVDDAFSYVVGQEDGNMSTRVVGQPAILNLVSDVLAGSMVQSVIDAKREQIRQERARIQQQQREQRLARLREREERLQRQKIQPVQRSKPVNPIPPAEPIPSINPDNMASDAGTNTNGTGGVNSAASSTSNNSSISSNNSHLSVPTDDSIEMVIIEDPNATY